MLKIDLADYKAPDMKIKRMIDQKQIIKLRKDLYETDLDMPGIVEACAIQTSSYLSFDYALSYYGLILRRTE